MKSLAFVGSYICIAKESIQPLKDMLLVHERRALYFEYLISASPLGVPLLNAHLLKLRF